jgi:hypothetical protein
VSNPEPRWSSEIGCEGGPILVANNNDFRHWFGAEPFPEEARRELHLWSAFTAELPKEFRPQGSVGHQYIESHAPSALRERLIEGILSQWPSAKVDRTVGTWVVALADGRKLHAALEPASEYDRAIRHLEQEAVYSYPPNAKCYLWSVEPGLVDVSVGADLDQLRLTQVSFADSSSDVAQAYAHASQAEAEPSGLSYDITSGPVVVAWAPNSFRDLHPSSLLSMASRDADARVLDFAIGGSGASLWLEPGPYLAHTGCHESDTWGVSWCSLERCPS